MVVDLKQGSALLRKITLNGKEENGKEETEDCP
jgi:hypothetical protein